MVAVEIVTSSAATTTVADAATTTTSVMLYRKMATGPAKCENILNHRKL